MGEPLLFIEIEERLSSEIVLWTFGKLQDIGRCNGTVYWQYTVYSVFRISLLQNDTMIHVLTHGAANKHADRRLYFNATAAGLPEKTEGKQKILMAPMEKGSSNVIHLSFDTIYTSNTWFCPITDTDTPQNKQALILKVWSKHESNKPRRPVVKSTDDTTRSRDTVADSRWR